MIEISPIAKLIREELDRLKSSNPSFSLRAFAKRLGMSPSAVSEIVRGKRNVTRKTAHAFMDRFKLPPEKFREIQYHLVASAPKGDRTKDIALIRKLVRDTQVAWNKHDTRKMAAFWAEEGCLIEPWGLVFEGREAIRKFYCSA